MSTGHPTGHPPLAQPTGPPPSSPDMHHVTPGQPPDTPPDITGHAEHRTPSPPLEGGRGYRRPSPEVVCLDLQNDAHATLDARWHQDRHHGYASAIGSPGWAWVGDDLTSSWPGTYVVGSAS